eukprot:CAMPEP_0205998854 /NCGR_PEP_ID=MMETSP1464-20131121/496_1 /ASSEMBLY_ACC=CAM_ASM_001124 /TAXON_ID=119497 /ORGANISM="Exanthemachrysis gayraliae, Strain RCC1523" /LENGTH=97 /DNA_ID=CAMNT_0053372019 /DNA_START=74 /DNA_END=364 /DNA_ORIENTATION=+
MREVGGLRAWRRTRATRVKDHVSCGCSTSEGQAEGRGAASGSHPAAGSVELPQTKPLDSTVRNTPRACTRDDCHTEVVTRHPAAPAATSKLVALTTD